MKKLIFLFAMTGFLISQTYAQLVDDAVVTRHLPVNLADEKYSSFINGFKSGFEKVKTGEITSADAVAANAGVDISQFPSLDEMASRGGYEEAGISAKFITDLKNRIEGNYDNMGQFRNELVKIALYSKLSEREAEVLALYDLATQEVVRTCLTTTETSNSAGLNFFNNSGETHGPAVKYKDIKLPAWVRCALGTIGSAIMGGLSGIRVGATIGVFLGGLGAAVGGAIGGIVGVVGGTFVGVANYCH